MHIEEITLHEYLDGELDSEALTAVEQHLADCAQCRATLAELQTLFADLDAITDLPLTVDLSQRVMAELNSPGWRSWSWLILTLQAIGTVVMSILLWPTAQSIWDWGQESMMLSWSSWVADMSSWWQEVLLWWTAVSSAPTFTLPTFTPPTFDLATGQWALLLGLAFVVWLADNRLFFPTQNPGQREGGSHG